MFNFMKQKRFVVECVGKQNKVAFIVRDFSSGEVLDFTSDSVALGAYFEHVLVESQM